jgi:oligopeptide/dipeptide ABC transporter ATP-binding protein
VYAVNGVDFTVPAGRSIGIVGESGCGKTVSAYSITKLLADNALVSGRVLYRTRDDSIIDLVELPPDGPEMRRIRSRDIAMIFQEPMSSLSPVHTVCNQLAEALVLAHGLSHGAARARAIELLEHVGIPNAGRRIDEYPFQFSGGMQQRVMIAMALARKPRILIADEPTTALDVTLQAQVLNLIQSLQNENDLSMVLITHDLGVVAHMVEFVNVMYLGRVVESGPTLSIFDDPRHPYTQGLLSSIPKLKGRRGKRVSSIPGSVPSTYSVPPGCPFKPRCAHAMDVCGEVVPERTRIGSDHHVRCHLYQPKEAINAGTGR